MARQPCSTTFTDSEMNGGRFRGRSGSSATTVSSLTSELKETSTEKDNLQKKAMTFSQSFRRNLPDFNESSLTGDCAYLGYAGKTEIGGEATFTTSAVGLINVADVIYNRLASISERFAKSVSYSMFDYYAIQLYYMRICCIELSNGSQDLDVRILTEYAKRNRFIVPGLLSDYLGCIGDFQDSTGLMARHREITLPDDEVVDGICGYFGQVTESTHNDYENRPAPGVITQRICEDLYYSLVGEDDEREWNLPELLQPEGATAGLPTVNLLGWSPACKLTEEQKRGLTTCGISATAKREFAFPGSTKFRHNHDLMSYVDRKLYELAGRIRCTQGLKTKSNGSIAQQDFQVSSAVCNGEFSTTEFYGKNGTQNCGMTKLDIRQEMWAHVGRFRLKREAAVGPDDVHHTWSCYRFSYYDCLTDSWISTRNAYYEFGNRNCWDVLRYQSASMDPKFGLNLMLDCLMIEGFEQSDSE